MMPSSHRSWWCPRWCHRLSKAVYQHQKTSIVSLVVMCCILLVIIQMFLNDCLPGGGDLCLRLDKDLDERTLPNGSWWQYTCLFERELDKPLEYNCQDEHWAGNWKVCFDEKYRPREECLVYSFGIANDFSFDEAMAYYGCEVFSFDPSMGLDDHLHSTNVHFLNIGLSHLDDDAFIPRFDEYVINPQKWKVRTLKSIKKMLGHEKRIIDILKFDVESNEWEIMKNIIKDGQLASIRQVLTEWHLFPDFPPKHLLKSNFDMVKNLKSHGLQRFYKHSFYRFHRLFFFNSQSDACYVNTAIEYH